MRKELMNWWINEQMDGRMDGWFRGWKDRKRD